jgi:hypothetical protein
VRSAVFDGAIISLPSPWKDGAGDGTRTRDVQLGKLAFFQLNYSRSVGTLNNSKDSCLRARPKSDSLRIRDSTSYDHAVSGFNSLEGIVIGLALKMDSKSTITPVG